MRQILEFIMPDDAFDSKTVAGLCKARDMALASLNDNGQPRAVRDVIVKRIVAAARRGERDPAKLCAAALAAFNSHRLFR